MNKEKIKNILENDRDYQNIKITTINVGALIHLLIHKKIITEEEFENAMETVSKFFEETENEKIKEMIDKGE